MSEEDVAVVRRAWETSTDEDLPLELWDPGLRIQNMPEFPIQAAYEGHEGLAKWRDDITEVIDDLHFEIEELVDLADGRVLSVQRATGRASHSGIEMDIQWASVMTIRDGRILHAQGYWTPEQAREAVGLSE